MWVLQYLDDIESDFSVFHRIDDIYSLPGPRFFRLAWRLPAYQGAIQLRYRAEAQQAAEQPSPLDQPYTYDAPDVGPPAGVGRRNWNPGTRATLQADAEVAGLFQFGNLT